MKGFSLIELIIIAMIISIGCVIAIPTWKALSSSFKTKQDIGRIVGVFKYSRSLALSTRKPVFLCPKTKSSQKCGKDWSSGFNIYILERNKAILRQAIEPFEDIKLIWNRHSQKIIFSANGLLSSQNGSFIYEDKNNKIKKKLFLSSTGRIRVS